MDSTLSHRLREVFFSCHRRSGTNVGSFDHLCISCLVRYELIGGEAYRVHESVGSLLLSPPFLPRGPS